MIIYLTIVGLLLIAIGLTGFVFSFGTLERVASGGAVLVGVMLCIGASRVSNKQKQREQSSAH